MHDSSLYSTHAANIAQSDRTPITSESLRICSALLQESFRLGAVYVDKTVACDSSEAVASARIEEVQRTVSLLDAKMPFHSVLLEDALCSEGGDSNRLERRCQTGDLLNVIPLSCLNPSIQCPLALQLTITGMYTPALS